MDNESRKRDLFDRVRKQEDPTLHAIAGSFASGEDIHDLHQQILLELWKSLNIYQGKASLRTWAYRVAINTAMAFSRKRQKQREVAALFLKDGTAAANPALEMQILDEFVHSLHEEDRAVFLLYLEDLSYRDMAEVTGLGENHLAVKISRLKKLFSARYVGG